MNIDDYSYDAVLRALRIKGLRKLRSARMTTACVPLPSV